jgi:hypothetical protein
MCYLKLASNNTQMVILMQSVLPLVTPPPICPHSQGLLSAWNSWLEFMYLRQSKRRALTLWSQR